MGPARFLNGLNITGDLTVTGNILPGANNTYDIGSTSLTWKAGYFKKMSINGADMASSTYVLDVGGTSHFESNAQFDADIIVDGISNLKGNTIIGTTTSGSNKTLTVNGHVIINPSYNTNNSYSEGLRINKDSNNWSVIALGGAVGTETGTSSAVWLIGANGSNNFYISNSGSDSSANRFQGTPTTGFRMYASASTSALQTGTLTLGSTTSAYNGSGAGGDVALEFWRGKNASWQIINHGGVLQFKNNYSNAAQSTYNQFALDLGYGGNDSIMYTNFKPYTGSSTATQSTLTLGLSTANWDTIFTKTLKFAYDSTDQYLTHAGVAELVNHSGKITLYRLLASGIAGSAASGNNLRPGIMLDATTGFISLEAPNSAPSATAGARIKFDFYDSSSSNNQPVFISHVVSDSYRPPYGLTVWGSIGTKPYAWFEVEGSIYLGAKNDISSETNVNTKRLATSLYIGYKKNGNVFISKAAVSGYDDWLRLNDLIDFTNGVYTPHELRSGNSLSVAADTLVSSTNRADATFYTGYDTSTATVTYINTTKNILAHRTSIGAEDATTDNNIFYVEGWSKFKGDILPDATNTYNLGKGGSSGQKRWKALFIGTDNSYGSGTQPIYWNDGVPKATTYALNATVPVGAANYILYYSAANTLATKQSANGALYATSAGGNLAWGTLPIAQGGTGLTSSPSMLTNLGSTTADNVLKASPRPGVTGTLGIGNGGTGLTSSPSMLINLGSTTAANVLQASPRPGVTGVLGTANGGTGSSSFTALRAIYTESATKLSSSNHYMSASKLAINSTSESSFTLYVNGSGGYNGDISQFSNSGYRWREHFYEANAGTSALGSGTQTFTVKGGRWGEVWFEYPRLTTTYATAGDASSTATTATAGGIYYWRQWSYNSSTADRLSYYENFYLPSVTKDRTGNASYEIFTSKSYTTLDGRYLKLAGGTMTGQIQKASTAMSWVNGRNGALIRNTTATFTANNYNPIVSVKSINGTWEMGTYTTNNSLYFTYITDANFNSSTNTTTAQMEFRGSDNSIRASKVYGAVWNDYAEYRQTKEDIKPGKVVVETGNGDLKLSDRRLQPGANVTTDTFGFAIGETEINKTPIAISGRVLVYPYESINEFKKHIGGPVCSGPNGTVSIMSINEERMYPSRIIGTISEIPDYEEWGTDNIKVNGRIWIRIR